MKKKEGKIFTEEKLYNLLSKERSMELQILKAIDGLKEEFVIILVTKPENYLQLRKAVVGLFGKKGDGLYITFNKPVEKLTEEFKENTKQLTFFDLISRRNLDRIEKDGNAYYLPSATHLTELSLAVEENLSGKKFLVLDSISTMLVYNEDESVQKFCHNLITKINKWKIKGIVLSVETTESESVIQTVSQFSDKIVEIRSEVPKM